MDRAEVASDSGLVCKATAEVEKALDNVDDLTPVSTVAETDVVSAPLKKALATLDQVETELQTAQLKEYRDQVALYETFVGLIRQHKTMTIEEAGQQLKAKAAPVIAAHEQLAETTACIEIQDAADSMDDCFRDKSKDDGPGKADS